MKHGLAYLARMLQWVAVGTAAVALGTIVAVKYTSPPSGQ